MKKLSADIVRFLEKQGFVIVSTIDYSGSINTAAKGIVGIEEKGRVFLLDLYKGKTYKNLRNNSNISVTAIDEHLFQGYNLKGKAKILEPEEFEGHIIAAWKERIVKRITNRILKNVTGGKRSLGRHPEAKMPYPKYLIEVDVTEIIDLTPAVLK